VRWREEEERKIERIMKERKEKKENLKSDEMG